MLGARAAADLYKTRGSFEMTDSCDPTGSSVTHIVAPLGAKSNGVEAITTGVAGVEALPPNTYGGSVFPNTS